MKDSDPDEIARAAAVSMYSRDHAAQHAGISVEEVRPGFARLKMKVRRDMVNGHQVCHGGFLFLLASDDNFGRYGETGTTFIALRARFFDVRTPMLPPDEDE